MISDQVPRNQSMGPLVKKKSAAQLALVDQNRERRSTQRSLSSKRAALNSRSRNFPCAHLALAGNAEHLREKVYLGIKYLSTSKFGRFCQFQGYEDIFCAKN